MHDPKTIAFEIKNPFSKDKYATPLVTIWHNDPETDGTDDSCGWFIRLRHADQEVFKKIVSEFESEWDRVYLGDNGYPYSCGWFNSNGSQNLSVQGIVFNMYLYASKIALVKGDTKPGKAWDVAWRFMKKHHIQITYFAENTRDSLFDSITRKFQIGTNTPYTKESRKSMIEDCARTVYTDVLRKNRSWWQHPRWHIHHWSIQFHPLRNLKRRYWDKCCVCGKRGFKGSAYGNWDGNNIWHSECDLVMQKSPPKP